MAVLVTGGIGQIGANVVRRLVQHHNDEVVVLDVIPPPDVPSPLTGLGDRVKYILGNVTDLAFLLNTIKANKIDSIVHLAKLLGGAAAQRPIEALHVNIIGTAHALEAVRILGLRRAVVLSSSNVMGNPDDAVTPRREEDIVLPATGMYPLSNLTIEQLTHTYRALYGVDAVAIRPRAVYGPDTPRRRDIRPVAQMVQAVCKGEDFVRANGADTWAEVTYMKDVAQGIALALKSPTKLPYHVYNISAGQRMSLGEVATILQGLFPKQKINLGEGLWDGVTTGTQSDLTYRWTLRPPQNIERAKADLKYVARWQTDRAIPDYVHWLQTYDYGTFD